MKNNHYESNDKSMKKLMIISFEKLGKKKIKGFDF